MHKRLSKVSQLFLISVLITGWIFSGWPQVWNFPPEIQKAEAAINQTAYLSSTASAKITSTVSWQTLASAPASSNVTTSCAHKKTTGYCQEKPRVVSALNGQAKPTAPNGLGWIYDTALDSTIPTGTWTFDMRTTNTSATGAGYMAVCAWKVKIASGAISSSVNIINCVDGTTNLQANITALYVSSVSVASVPAVSFAADEYLYVEYWLHTTTVGTGATAKMTFEANAGASDDIVLPGASTNLAPTAPSQDSPANTATGVSLTPTFLITATDPETNNLGYKVTIYSENTCTTVVQTNDQAVSATGWTGTNATCTNNPIDCYLSNTQGSFLTQTSLSANTQYWWKASAKDPDGNGSFTNSSTCNTFTTVDVIVSVSVSDGVVTYGTMVAGTSKTTVDLTDTQTLTNDGNVTEIFNIMGQNTACPWTLAATAGTDQYVHQFCKATDVSCASPPTNYTGNELTTGYVSLYTGVLATGTRQLDLRVIVPTVSSCFTSQAIDVTIQATQ